MAVHVELNSWRQAEEHFRNVDQDQGRKHYDREMFNCELALNLMGIGTLYSCSEHLGVGIEEASRRLHATMSHRSDGSQARSGLIPVLEGRDRDLVFRERSCTCRSNTAWTQSSVSLRGQQAICLSFLSRTSLSPV